MQESPYKKAMIELDIVKTIEKAITELERKHDEDKDYIIHFALPGHNKDTCDVIKSDKYIIVKSKKKDDSTYSFYKRIPLIKTTYEVQTVIFKDGILSIAIKDSKQENKEEMLEIIQQ